MAKIGEVYKGGNYLVTEDLNGQLLTATIDAVTVEEVGDKIKVILHLSGQEKCYPCNATNAKTLAQVFGDDETDNWVGKEIVLRPDTTNFQGKLVPCIRVDSVAMQAAQVATV
jgi:hypothetical protein